MRGLRKSDFRRSRFAKNLESGAGYQHFSNVDFCESIEVSPDIGRQHIVEPAILHDCSNYATGPDYLHFDSLQIGFGVPELRFPKFDIVKEPVLFAFCNYRPAGCGPLLWSAI